MFMDLESILTAGGMEKNRATMIKTAISQREALKKLSQAISKPIYVEKTQSSEIRASNIDPQIVSSWYDHLNKSGILVVSSRTDILNFLIHRYNLVSYLEIGVRDGNNFRNIRCLNKTGVDPSKEFPDIENVVYTTSDEFFSSLEGDVKYDLIFIDGLHLDHQVSKDIQNSLSHLYENGIILMHDCNPPTIHHAREDFSDLSTPAGGKWNGTTWKAYARERCTNKDIFACVIDLDWGCGLIHIQDKQKLYNKDELDTCLEYTYMDENRKSLLNLISVDKFLSMDIGKDTQG